MKPPLHTHYDNLKVRPDATAEEIRAAYRRLCKQYHPDCRPQHPEAERIMQLINQAYAVLSNPEARQKHDEWITEQQQIINQKRIGSPMPPNHYPPEQKLPVKTLLLIGAVLIAVLIAVALWSSSVA
ncbi:MAG: DnaJ domain-containing protein [Neisseria sp.]|nr:DnaJ domain-containing protein [Neisseria sp.]